MQKSNRIPSCRRLVTAGAALAALAGLTPVAGSSASVSVHAVAGTISTIAGGTGGPELATKAAVPAGGGLAVGNGHVYVADGLVQEVGAHGELTTPVGDLNQPSGAGIVNGSPAADANLDAASVAAAPNGDLVIADPEAEQVLVAAARTGWYGGLHVTAGDIYVLAGNGKQGFAGMGTPARSAELDSPVGVAVDSAGNVLIADTYNNRIRVVADRSGMLYGKAMKAGHIYDIAGDKYTGYHGDGRPAVKASLDKPYAMAVDGAGNVVIADTYNDRVRVVAASSGLFYGQAMTAGDIYTIAGDGSTTVQTGGPGTQSGLNDPQGVGVDQAGNVLIAGTGTRQVYVLAATTGTFYGQAMTAGYLYLLPTGPVHLRSGGTAPGSKLSPAGVAVDGAGNVLIAEGRYLAVRAATSGSFYGQAMTGGQTYAVAGDGSYAFSGNGGPALKAQFNDPQDVTADGSGNVLVSDAQNNMVRVIAGRTGTFYGRPMTAGDVYALAGTGGTKFNGDGELATSATLDHPQELAIDSAGNVLIADLEHDRIRVVAASSGLFYGQAMTAGHIYTIAHPYGNGVAVDGAGNVVMTAGCEVKVLAEQTGTFYGQAMTAGHTYRVAGTGGCAYKGDGGPGTKAEVNYPYGVVVDAAGNILIADTYNNRVRVLAGQSGTFYGQPMTAGYIYTVAGDGHIGGTGDGGPATSAGLLAPTNVAVDGNGNVVIADAGDTRVRVVAASAGTFYGVTMSPGDIYTVAGDGTAGFSGDGGLATSAEIDHAYGVAVDGPDLLIADSGTGRVRLVTG